MKQIKKLIILSLLIPSAPAFSQEEQVSAMDKILENPPSIRTYIELEYDDNPNRLTDNEESDLKETIGVDVGYNYKSRAIDLSMQYGINHEQYQDNSYNNKTRFQGSSQVQISTIPERYSWVIQHQQTISEISTQNVNTPDNLDQRSVLTTGPNLILQLSPVDSLTASARYIDVRFDEQEGNDTERNQARLIWSHRLNTRNSLGLNASYTDVESDIEDFNYTQQRLGLSFSSETKLGSYSLEAGESRLERDLNTFEDVNGTYARFRYDASWSGNTLGLSYNKDITDSSIGLSQSFKFNSGYQDGDTNFNKIDVVTRTRHQITYGRKNANGRLRFSLGLSQDKEDYETLLNDQKTQSVRTGLSYSIAENLRTSLSYHFRKTEYIENPLLGEDENSNIRLSLSHRLGDEWSFIYSLSREERENDLDMLRDHESLKAIVRINYQIR